MILLQPWSNNCRLPSMGRKTITLSKTLPCNCNSLWHTLYKYLMHVDIGVVLTMPRILYLLSQTCKHPVLHFSLAAHSVERRGGRHSPIFLETGVPLGLDHHLARVQRDTVTAFRIDLVFILARFSYFCRKRYEAKRVRI